MADEAAGAPGEPSLGTEVWRRIPPWHFPNPGVERPKSPAFCDDPDGSPMSVVIARPGREPQEVLAGHDGYGLVALRVEDLLSLQLIVAPNPLQTEPDHALVIGPKTDATRRAMSKLATWVIPPPQPQS